MPAPLTSSDAGAAADSLASAFAVDPVWTWLLGDVRDPAARLRVLFDRLVSLELAKSEHLVEHADGGAAVAIWHEVDDWKVPPTQIVRNAPTVLRAFRHRSLRLVTTLDAIERRHPDAPHRYLAFLAVHPTRQGQGLGGRLLQSAVDRCDEIGVAAYLESSNPRNQSLYARFGFVADEPIRPPGGAPPVTPMWRDAR